MTDDYQIAVFGNRATYTDRGTVLSHRQQFILTTPPAETNVTAGAKPPLVLCTPLRSSVSSCCAGHSNTIEQRESIGNVDTGVYMPQILATL
jgi:hypothetical protein